MKSKYCNLLENKRARLISKYKLRRRRISKFFFNWHGSFLFFLTKIYKFFKFFFFFYKKFFFFFSFFFFNYIGYFLRTLEHGFDFFKSNFFDDCFFFNKNFQEYTINALAADNFVLKTHKKYYFDKDNILIETKKNEIIFFKQFIFIYYKNLYFMFMFLFFLNSSCF